MRWPWRKREPEWEALPFTLTPDEVAALRAGQGVFVHQSASGDVIDRHTFTPAYADTACRCGHRKSKHGFMGHPDCTDGEGDLFCLCERFEDAS